MEQPKLIIFDLNKTLIMENSWYELNLAMGVTETEDKQLVDWGQEGIISDAVGQQILCSLYKKRGNPTRAKLLEVLSKYTYRNNAKSTISALQAKGYTLALVSSAMDLLVERIANELNIKIWRANNSFVFDKNEVLDQITTTGNETDFKVQVLTSICEELEIDTSDVMCVGDGHNDLGVFEVTNCGVTFADADEVVQSSAKYTIDDIDGLLSIVV